MSAYYNELDSEKAEWIRELIKAEVVAPGDVDERSILDVRPDDLRGYTQCHFFAGIGVWSYSLRLAGWDDSRGVWTGSCPCPSFSCAGKGEGFDDPRHLWPAWFSLIRECRPGAVIGEQVAAAIGHGWLDLVCGDMEAEGYAIAPAVLGAHSAGAPHIRQRLYFGAYAADPRRNNEGEHGSRQLLLPTRSEQRRDISERSDTEHDGLFAADGLREATESPLASGQNGIGEPAGGGDDRGSTDAGRPRREGDGLQPLQRERPDAGTDVCATGSGATGFGTNPNGRQSSNGDLQRSGEQRLLTEDRGAGERDDTERKGLEGHRKHERERNQPGWLSAEQARFIAETGATRGFWGDCDWWYGRDGKYRPIGPGLQPLAHGATARVLRLRGYGDAICAETAKEFIQAFRESVAEAHNE